MLVGDWRVERGTALPHLFLFSEYLSLGCRSAVRRDMLCILYVALERGFHLLGYDFWKRRSQLQNQLSVPCGAVDLLLLLSAQAARIITGRVADHFDCYWPKPAFIIVLCCSEVIWQRRFPSSQATGAFCFAA